MNKCICTCSKFGIRAVLVLVIVVGLVSSVSALAPTWMPGFPLRAGATVILMWTPVPGATGYKLFKKVDSGESKEVYSGPLNTFNDPDAPATKTIEYKVVPVVGGKDGDVSSPSILKGIEPIKPPEFTGFLPSADSINIRWTMPKGAMFFNLYKSDKKEGPFNLLGSFQQDTYVDRAVKPGVPNFYKVSAIDQNNTESSMSPVGESKIEVAVATAASDKDNWVKVVAKGEFAGEDFYEFSNPSCFARSSAGEILVADKVGIHICDADGKFIRRINLEKGWSTPTSMAETPDKKLLVTFAGESLIRKMDFDGTVIRVIKYPKIKPEDTPGGAMVLENSPNSAVEDPDGNVWVADGLRYQVIKMRPAEPEAELLTVVGRFNGMYTAKTMKPDDLPAVSQIYSNPFDGKIYAVLSVNAEIAVFDQKSGKFLGKWGGLGMAPSKFQGISGIEFKKDGNIVVLDQLMQQIKEFTKEYKYVATYVTNTEKRPFNLAANFAGQALYSESLKRFYVLSGMGSRVYMFDAP